MSEENKENLENSTTKEIIEIEWEELQEIVSIRNSLLELENYLSSVLLRQEKEKKALLNRSESLQNSMYQAGAAIRATKNIDPELTYELKLPDSEGEKGYFVRKDS